MNCLHRWYCRSDHWRRTVQGQILPWTLNRIDLGDMILEVGPGQGVMTDWLCCSVKSVESLEIDRDLANCLQRRFAGSNVNVRCGDATRMPYDNCLFSSVVSFTMLHHIPTTELQDRFFHEAYRVLQPGGIFVGVDSLPSILMTIFHVRDTLTPVAPHTLAQRLESVGFTETYIDTKSGRIRFSAKRSVDSPVKKSVCIPNSVEERFDTQLHS